MNWSLVAAIVAVAIIQLVAVVLASWIDSSWHLKSPGRGLFEHYGAWAILVTDPLLLIATGFAYYRFRLAIASLPVCPGEPSRRRLNNLASPFLRLARAADNGIFLYVLFLIVGVLSWLNNVRQTIDPLIVYRHDVFDSAHHMAGFIAYKVCLFVSWVIVYPVAGYELIVISFSTWVILVRSRRRHLICPNVRHPDNCYGLRNIGTLNVAILSPYLLVYAVMFSLMVTHATLYESILVPLGVVTVLFLLMSFIVIMPVYRLLQSAKAAVYKNLVDHAQRPLSGKDAEISEFAVERLCYTASNASPYTSGTKFVLAGMRLTPIVTFVAKLLQQYHGQVFRL